MNAYGGVSFAVPSTTDVDSFPSRGSCLKAPLDAIHGATDVEKLNNPTLVHLKQLYQRAANYMEEARRSFTAMWSRRQSSHADVNFHRPLSVISVRCSSVHCFETRITAWNCSTANELLLHGRKILFLEDR
ncbi:hypothetical protein TNCV_1207911 [Trichonephila clavipes]|nr:hypothetical protein TNCV_1207911 [Trichonephila clavipes]